METPNSECLSLDFFSAGEDFFISSNFFRIKIEFRKRYQAAFFMILLFDVLFTVARIVGQVFLPMNNEHLP